MSLNNNNFKVTAHKNIKIMSMTMSSLLLIRRQSYTIGSGRAGVPPLSLIDPVLIRVRGQKLSLILITPDFTQSL